MSKPISCDKCGDMVGTHQSFGSRRYYGECPGTGNHKKSVRTENVIRPFPWLRKIKSIRIFYPSDSNNISMVGNNGWKSFKMNVCIKIIPHKEQRHPTVGDWFFDVNGDLFIRVSKMSDWRYEMCVAAHELIEVLICKHDGVSQKSVAINLTSPSRKKESAEILTNRGIVTALRTEFSME